MNKDKYTKPIAIQEADMSEGVFLASGSCYNVNAYIHQRPETGRNDYRINLQAHHNADHACNGQLLIMTFNQPVEFVSANGELLSCNDNIIKIKLSYWNNPNDNIGMGDIIVKSADGLEIVNCQITDDDWKC